MQMHNWQITKFHGIHSFPADVPEGSAVLSQDLVNLRINRWGHLRPRPPIRHLNPDIFSDFWDDGSAAMNYWSAGGKNLWNDGIGADEQITGVAGSAEFLFYLRSDGTLFRESVITPTLTQISGVENLRGRLSIVSAYETFVILTSEGDDRGYYISNNSLFALPLAIPRPDISDFTMAVGLGTGSNPSDPALTRNRYATDRIFYKISFASQDKEGFESQPSQSQARVVRQYPASTSYVTQFSLPGTAFVGLDPRITHINFYRSLKLHPTGTPDEDIDFYRLDSVAIASLDTTQTNVVVYQDKTKNPGQLEDISTFTDLAITETLKVNVPMPRNIKQLAHHKGRIYGVDDNVLRFTDVRYGNPRWDLWPEQNAENFPHKLEFCASYRGFLIVGGTQGLYAIAGDSPHNFAIAPISRRGPVSPHAWAIVNELLTFVSVNGIYATDGAVVQPFGKELKGYFNRHAIEDGAIAQLINDASLFSVTREADTLHFVNEDGRWTRLDTEPIRQVTTLPLQFGINADTELTTVIADNRESPRLLNWIVEDEISHDNDYAGDRVDWKWESQELDWNEEGLGERLKNFKWLEISGIATHPEITLTFYIDDKAPIVVTKQLDRELTDRFKPLRARIGRWGYALRFTIEGEGEVTLRGLKLVIRT